MAAVLANESAMGLYAFSWVTDGTKHTLIWGDGMDVLFTYRSKTVGKEITVPVIRPQRFGFKPAMKLSEARRFAQAFADGDA